MLCATVITYDRIEKSQSLWIGIILLMCSLHYGFKTDTETCDIELGFQKSSTVLGPQI